MSPEDGSGSVGEGVRRAIGAGRFRTGDETHVPQRSEGLCQRVLARHLAQQTANPHR